MIKVRYSSVDRYRESRSFKTLKGARSYAQKRIGKNPEIGSTYAVSGDGIGKIMVEGAALRDLFGDEKPAAPLKIYIVNAIGKYFTSRAEAEAVVKACIEDDPFGGPYDIQEEDASDCLPPEQLPCGEEIDF